MDYKERLDALYEQREIELAEQLKRDWKTVTCGMCEMSYLPSDFGIEGHNGVCWCTENEEFQPSDMLSGEIECWDVLCVSM